LLGGALGYFTGKRRIAYAIVGATGGAAFGWLAGAALHIAFRILGAILRFAVYPIGVLLVIAALLSFIH
jgi:hypothetical protein